MLTHPCSWARKLRLRVNCTMVKRDILAILLMTALYGCSIEKQANNVINNREQFARVGKEWVKVNPLDIDTVDRIIPGDTVIKWINDTIVSEIPCRDFVDTTVQGVRILVKDGQMYFSYKDTTVKPTIVVKEFENLTRISALQSSLDACEDSKVALRAAVADMAKAYRVQISEDQKEIKKWKTNFWLLIAFIVVVVALVAYAKTGRLRIPRFGK